MRHERSNAFAPIARKKPGLSASEVRRETRRTRAKGLLAILIAAAILAVFNSQGLLEYTRDLAEAKAGRPVFAAAQQWDHAMDRIGAKQLGNRVRDLVAQAQDARWTDVAKLFETPPQAGAHKKMLASEPGAPLYTGSLPEQRASAVSASGQ